jgi:tRNA(adenine34) deaminase
MIDRTTDEFWMRVALEAARIAMSEGETPVGAVLVKDGQEAARGWNRGAPLGHAEKRVIEEILARGEKFLYEYTLYVTIEPCLMCAGIIIWSRVGRVVFGASDPKAGAVGSLYHVLADRRMNHRPEIEFGILEAECRELIQTFFRNKRTESCRSG